MLLHLTAGRQALWTLLPRYRTKFWRSILSIPAILLPSTSGLKSCSAPRLPRFRLHGPPRRAGWRDWSTACRDVIALIRQVNGERSPIGIKFKPIPATSTNIIQAWQFWLPLHLPRVPLPSSPPCDWRNLKENEAAHEAIIYYMYCERLFTSNQSPHPAQIIWVYCDYHNMMNVILFRY